jgi:DNA-binding phage protein
MIENGKGNPSFLTLTKIAAVLGLEINVQIKKTIE